MIRDQLVEPHQHYGGRDIAGIVTLVYDHHPQQHVQATLTDIQHDHHEMDACALLHQANEGNEELCHAPFSKPHPHL